MIVILIKMHLLSIYYVSGTVVRALCVYIHLIFSTTLQVLLS